MILNSKQHAPVSVSRTLVLPLWPRLGTWGWIGTALTFVGLPLLAVQCPALFVDE